MAVNGIGSSPVNGGQATSNIESYKSESSFVMIDKSDDDEDKGLTMFAYHVEISNQAKSLQIGDGSMENASFQGIGTNTYNSSGRMAAGAVGGSSGASGSSGAGGVSGSGGSGAGGGS